MEIYFVRHGQTGGNQAHRHQAVNSGLTFTGEAQAAKVAAELRDLQPTHLITSGLVRAIETARVIAEVCDLTPEINQHFIELERPEHLYGQYHRSVPSLFFYAQWYLGIESKRVGGESYAALRQRIQQAQAVLQQYPADARIVVVSHSVFITLFIAHMCRSTALTPLQVLQTFQKILSMPNTHVIPVSFDADTFGGTCAWSVKD